LVVFSSTNKTYHHDITKILLKVALNTINLNLEAKCYVVNILIIHISIDLCSENDKIYFPEDSTDSDSVNGEECYDKLEELLDTRKSRSKKKSKYINVEYL
jgi:hypothetical protein